ncbi:hypothetical protein AAVH_22918 [Aphelenchoides avenae]|nr:hypothetical protein AAVH_22918 [Aphelenchus avenae]
MKELADKFYWPIVLLLLSISAFFIAAAAYCAIKAMHNKQTLVAARRKGYDPLLDSDTQLPLPTFREEL